MKLREIETPVTALSGIGPAAAKLLAKCNIFTVADLLSFYPRTWEDRTRRVPIAAFASAPKVHTIARVEAHEWFGYGRMRTLKLIISDGSATASLVCFNRPFYEKTFPVGSVISVTAPFSVRYNSIQTSSFEAECIAKNGTLEAYAQMPVPCSKVISVYPLTAGITQAQIRKAVAKALKEYGRGISDEIPEHIAAKYNLMRKQRAIAAMHQPETLEEAQNARKTLIFEELFLFQLAIVRRFYERKRKLPEITADAFSVKSELSESEHDGGNSESGKDSASRIDDDGFAASLSPRQKSFFFSLAFKLTADQKRTVLDCNTDIDMMYAENAGQQSCAAMSRLIQGDVGSGKTLAAFFAALRVIDWGGQCAFLAPTELLARQHAENAARMLENTCSVRLAFLTGNVKSASRKQLLCALKNGEVDIIIGTHALFSPQVAYNDLRLCIIDEQHRFGVLQRNAILAKGRKVPPAKDTQTEKNSAENPAVFSPPGLLMLSATPIPRTLALTVFGDLDISYIRTMPAGRKPIQTHLTKRGNENRVYEAVRKELAAGHQAYFVYPRIETDKDMQTEQTEKNEPANEDMPARFSDGQSLKTAEDMYAFLSAEVYPEFKCAVIHSRVDEETQHRILEDFRLGKIQILVATSVVEVGVDVPNATCMVIEQAERFGLAALHQLRGRVGRSPLQSHCFLIYGNKLSETGKARLKALHESTDGFRIAEQDMILRGPGEVSGIQQSGYLTLGIADPLRDKEMLICARDEAVRYLSEQLPPQ
ncbi:MAG: ATP-dependent DNA helicase RecG [Bacteroides sp.]|nr:ATP-dependent DNA helicase RecG [Prevotella sp.]MCM1408634.1 ATP-dependent DNA helicase RecG [Treponema brennaborense]MCM1470708.1 ATP-dependent DNA helicase RecG [Bacteroides sp.]